MEQFAACTSASRCKNTPDCRARATHECRARKKRSVALKMLMDEAALPLRWMSSRRDSMATEGLILPRLLQRLRDRCLSAPCRTDAYVCIWVFRLFRFLPLLLLLGHENPDLL